MENWIPDAVALVTSGSRGNRLLFYHRGIQFVDGGVKDVLSELPPTTLAEILAPDSLMINNKFELTVDEWKFIGHPFSVHNDNFSIAFNIVFVLQSYCSPEIIAAYDHLAHLLGSAVVHEEYKCGFLCREVSLLMQFLEEADIPDPCAGYLIKESSLAGSLALVLQSLQDKKTSVQVKINRWSEVNTLLHFSSETQRGTVLPCVRSYSALLLFESADAIIKSLPPSSSPAMNRLLKAVSPMKSLQVVSLDADIPLAQVLHMACHLVHWQKAMTIYPLSESNVYITSPTADCRTDSELATKFSNTFEEFTLVEFLSNFSLPVSLGDLKELFENEEVIQMVVWLLQHKQIVQLHTYVYIVPPPAHRPPHSPSSLSSGRGSELTVDAAIRVSHSAGSDVTDDSGRHSVGQLLQHLTPEERQSVLNTAASADPEDLEQFGRLSKYFRGQHHLEGIMLMENVPRSQLLTLIDKFSEVLVTCTLPEQLAA